MNTARLERAEIRARTCQLLLENIVLCLQTSIVFLKTIDCVRAIVEMIGIGMSIVFVQFKLVLKLFDLDSILETTTNYLPMDDIHRKAERGCDFAPQDRESALT